MHVPRIIRLAKARVLPVSPRSVLSRQICALNNFDKKEEPIINIGSLSAPGAFGSQALVKTSYQQELNEKLCI
jgi:hypothetical protein